MKVKHLVVTLFFVFMGLTATATPVGINSDLNSTLKTYNFSDTQCMSEGFVFIPIYIQTIQLSD